MSFKALTESQILANMIDTYSSLIPTVDDMTPGSNIRSIFEAFAMELRRLYQNAQESAADVQKTAAYSMFNFPLNPAQAAYTVVNLTVPSAPITDIPIPAGTTVGVTGTNIQYKTPASMTWLNGQISFQARVVCTQSGAIGNKRANEITQLITPITGLSAVSVTNPLDVRTGSDLETDDQRSNRFQEWINSLHRGDTRSIPYGAKTTKIIDPYGYVAENVAKSQLVEGSGSNLVYVDNGYYTTSTQLVAQCQKIIDGYVDTTGALVVGYKAAGIPTTAIKCNLQNLSFTANVAPKTGYTFAMIQQSVISALTTLVQSLDIGQSLLVKDINLAIGTTPGVLNFTHNISADISPAAGTLIKFGIGQPIVSPL